MRSPLRLERRGIVWYNLQVPLCSPKDLDCVNKIKVRNEECLERCEGTIMDVERVDSELDTEGLAQLMKDYDQYYKNKDFSQIVLPDTMKGIN